MNLKKNLHTILNNIIDAKLEFNRSNDNIKLLAVSKTRSASEIRQLYNLGHIAFGESYLQESIAKQQQLTDCHIEWHFIGPIQSNKTKQISQNFSWVQSLAREKIAITLNDFRLESQPKLNVLIQINLNNEPSKTGLLPEEALNFCKVISKLPKLKLRGLMAIPQKSTELKQQRLNFSKLYKLYASLKQQFELDTLSMGMSNDYQAAIAQGSTMVRVGRQLFETTENNTSPPLK